MRACLLRTACIATVLVEAGADIEAASKVKIPTFQQYFYNHFIPFLPLSVHLFVQCFDQTKGDRSTALQITCAGGKTEIAAMLLSHGAKTETRDKVIFFHMLKRRAQVNRWFFCFMLSSG
jgi:hypothetical protein